MKLYNMKYRKLMTLALAFTAMLPAAGQQYMRVWQNGDSHRFALADINYSQNGSVISIGDSTYLTAEVDSITMVHMVKVNFDGNTATVDLGNAPGVSYTAQGAHVVITNTNVGEEMEFILSGTSTDGSLLYNGSYKCKFHLNNVNLTSSKGAAMDIECGKRIDLILMDGTDNSFTDCAGGQQSAAFYCDGHMEVEGHGNLSVKGNTKHALATNEYLFLKKSTGHITVTGAPNDAIHAGQYFMMNGGDLELNGMSGDGIQADMTRNPMDEFNGMLFINGGTIKMTVAGEDVKGIKSDADLTITGGDININVTGNGSKGISTPENMLVNTANGATNIYIVASGSLYYDPVKQDDVRCMGIKVDKSLNIDSGTVTVINNGPGSKGIKVDAAGSYREGPTAIVRASKDVPK